jgi:hypothetical protein
MFMITEDEGGRRIDGDGTGKRVRVGLLPCMDGKGLESVCVCVCVCDGRGLL